MQHGAIRAAARVAAVVISLLASACGSEPSPPSLSRLDLAASGPLVHSGEANQVTVTARDRDGGALPGVSIVLEASAGGSVTPAQGATGTDGTLNVTWTPADRDEPQTLTARAGSVSRALTIVTSPRFTSLELAPTDTVLPDFGAEFQPRLLGRTTTGRVVNDPDPSAVEVASDARGLDRLPVLERAGGGFRALGPGRAELRATIGGVVSNLAEVTVPLARPVLLAPASSAPIGAGGVVVLEGAGLDDLSPAAVAMDGAPAEIVTQGPSSLTVRLPSTPAACSGDAQLDITVATAWVPQPIRVSVLWADAVNLAVGEVRFLQDPVTAPCLRLAPVANAGYVLAYADTRSIESARTAREDQSLRNASFTISVRDRTASTAPIATGSRLIASRAGDLLAGGPAAVGPPPDDWTMLRTTPWAAGDRFSVFLDGEYLPGQVFRATDRLAIATLDRDQALDIVSRLDGFEEGLQKFAAHGIPTLLDAFGSEWPATTEATGQTLAILAPISGAGGLAAILRHQTHNGVLNQDVVLFLNPAIGPGTGRLFFDWHSLTHELAHAMQDRHALIRCRDGGDCGFDWFGFRWSTEGGAELVKEEAVRRAGGLSRTGNYPRETVDVLNLYGFRAFWGDQTPHWDWGWGYSSTSFALGYLLDRAIAAGGSYPDVFKALSRGAFEGWFGYHAGPVRRPGLQERLAPWLGAAWDPVEVVSQAALAVALDDRIADPVYQIPLVSGMRAFFPEAAHLVSGEGDGVSVQVRGDTFAHYSIDDGGRGGSYLIESGVPGLRWAIARVR